MSSEWLGERPPSPGLCRQVLSLAYQKLRGSTHQKLAMDMLALEEEKHHGAANLALQKVKVSGRRSQCLCSGDKPGSYGLAPSGVVLEPPGSILAMSMHVNTPPGPAESESAHVQTPGEPGEGRVT